MRKLVITGATGGLGSEVSRRLEHEYECVTLGSRDVDLTNETQVKAKFDEIGTIYGLVHLVGAFSPGDLAGTSFDTWSTMLSVNATTAFLAAREALPHLSRPGRIVAVSSIATLAPSRGSLAYTVAKSALNALVQSIAAEQRANGITANAVLPDSMATPAMLQNMDASRLVPLDRVAETIAFLLSDAAAATSGALIPIRA